MELLAMFLLGPFAALGFMLAASWWVTAIFIAGIGLSTYSIYQSDSDFEVDALVIFLGLTFVALVLGGWLGSEETGFFQSVGQALKSLLNGAGIYAVWGLVFLFPLWFMNGRRFARRYDRAVEKYQEQDHGINWTKEKKWEKALSSSGLKSDTHILARSKEGIAKLASFFFMWPMHVIEKLFSEFFKEIPHFLARMLGKPLDRVSEIATGGSKRSGRPD